MTSQSECRAAWINPGGLKAAETLDAAFPNGVCEVYSLSEPVRDHVSDDEVVARVLTGPHHYRLETGELLTQKLTSAYAGGISLIRTGASDADIQHVIATLMSAPDATLVGAVVLRAHEIRDIGAKEFCVYDTDAEPITRHADIVGTFDATLTKSGWVKEHGRRRRRLHDVMLPRIIFAKTAPDLIRALRAAGI